MKCQRCGCSIEKVVPFEENHGIKDNTIYTFKTQKIVNGVIVDFRIFFVCEKCWKSANNEVEYEKKEDIHIPFQDSSDSTNTHPFLTPKYKGE